AEKKAQKAAEKAEKKAQKAAEKAEKKAQKKLLKEKMKEIIKSAVIEAVDKIIEESDISEDDGDEIKKLTKEVKKESKKGLLVAKVLSNLEIKALDEEYKGKSPDANYREQLEKIEKKFIKSTQKVKSEFFEDMLKVNPGITVEEEYLEETESQVTHSDMKQGKNVGIMVKKTDDKVRDLLQSENPDEDSWKIGIDAYKGETRLVLELSDTDPETIEKIQSVADIEVQDDNLVQITADISDLPRINSLQEVEKTRATTNLSDFNRDTFVESQFVNSDEIIKTNDDVKSANLIQLSDDRSDDSDVQSGIISTSSSDDDVYPVSEGVFATNADLVQSYGITGKDVKVAVLDIVFDVDNPKISDNIADFKSFRNSFENSMVLQTIEQGESVSHGTAVAEIISDVAPDSDLYLYEMNTDVEFGRAIDEAITNNVDVIAMAAGWPNLPTDGSSHITKKVEYAISNGISVIVPSGNFAQKHWEGQFSDDDLNAWHSFAENDEGLSINVSESQVSNKVPIMVYLNWDDGRGGYSDFDLVLVDPLGQIVDYSANTQTSDSEKTESVFFMPQMAGLYAIGISYSGEIQSPDDVPDYSTLELFSVNNSIEYPISESSVVVPADAQGVIVVGAIDNNSGLLESFSSQGPTNNGQSVPSVVGPNGVTTIAYGGNLFYGTSATTPHVAGIVALMIDANSELSPDELLAEIEQNAKADFTQTNPNQYGFGMVDAAFLIEN
ncbi:MAG: S8 family serine peptidase, partial [Nitrosopumilus sp.]